MKTETLIHYQKEYYQRHRNKLKLYHLKRYFAQRKRLISYQKQRYRNDIFLLRKYQSQRYHSNKSKYIRKQHKRYRADEANLKTYQSAYRTMNHDKTLRLKRNRCSQKKCFLQPNPEKICRLFLDLISRGPEFVCVSCERSLFLSNQNNNLVLLKNVKLPISMSYVLENTLSFDGQKYLCQTCKRYLLKEKLPLISVSNDLFVETTPEELCVKPLEAYLMAQRKLFAKIVKMPRGEQLRLKGSVVNVPVPVDKVAAATKKIGIMKIVMVKYKRRLICKTDVSRDLARIDKVLEGLRKLSEINTFYKGLELKEFRLSVPDFSDKF